MSHATIAAEPQTIPKANRARTRSDLHNVFRIQLHLSRLDGRSAKDCG
jgi:hypothetical protein